MRLEPLGNGIEIFVSDAHHFTTDTILLADFARVKNGESGVELGAGEIVLNSIDTDGVKNGYELTITDMIAKAVQVPVIASGGAGTPAHIVDLFRKTSADAALVASMVHFGDYTVPGIKGEMLAAGIPVRKKMNGEV